MQTRFLALSGDAWLWIDAAEEECKWWVIGGSETLDFGKIQVFGEAVCCGARAASLCFWCLDARSIRSEASVLREQQWLDSWWEI